MRACVDAFIPRYVYFLAFWYSVVFFWFTMGKRAKFGRSLQVNEWTSERINRINIHFDFFPFPPHLSTPKLRAQWSSPHFFRCFGMVVLLYSVEHYPSQQLSRYTQFSVLGGCKVIFLWQLSKKEHFLRHTMARTPSRSVCVRVLLTEWLGGRLIASQTYIFFSALFNFRNWMFAMI